MPRMKTYVELFERLRSVHLHVDAQRCLTVRNRNVRCNRCAAACTSGCISVIGRESADSQPGKEDANSAARNGQATRKATDSGKLSINPENCIGCATCATVCPTGAIVARKPDDRMLAKLAANALHATGGTVAFACEQLAAAARGRYNPETVVSVRCIGRIDASLLVLLAAAGAKTIRLSCGNCTSCEHVAGRRAAEAAIADANAVFAAWGVSAQATIAPKLPPACRAAGGRAYDPERRAFLRTAGEGVRDAAHDAGELAIDHAFDRAADTQHARRAVMQNGALPRFLPTHRSVLLDALERLGSPSNVMISTGLWAHVVLDETRCTGCGMCATFCPTGALTRRNSEAGNPSRTSGTWLADRNAAKTGFADATLIHAPGLCLQCRTCEQLCPEHAIELSESVFAVDICVGAVDEHSLRDAHRSKGGPDAIRNSMAKLINSPYVTG